MSDFKICFNTGNPDKVNEFTKIFTENKFDITNIRFTNFDVYEIQDEVQNVSYSKCEQLVNGKLSDLAKDHFIIVEDVGFCLNELSGTESYIKHFLKNGAETYYKMSQGFDNKDAVEYCFYTIWDPNRQNYTQYSEGIHGQIVDPRGNTGFGYDSIFEPYIQTFEPKKTYAEMTPEEKNNQSARSNAISKMINGFKNYKHFNKFI